MATPDLDRHLKAGRQTIAVLAGGAAILTAGHDGKIGLPIAVTLALISAFWGILAVIDANYWSLRAIAFLANVEAVYFSAQDRAYFNPYIGHHPALKLTSLRYMFWLCVTFGNVALLSLLWAISLVYPTATLIWSMPFLVGTWGCVWVIAVWRKRIQELCLPGPGAQPVPAAAVRSLQGL